jgi:hypothetical protein
LPFNALRRSKFFLKGSTAMTLGDMMAYEGEQHLGDMVYASFDGWCLWLRIPNDEEEKPDDYIKLNPLQFAALCEYAARIDVELRRTGPMQ